MRSDEKRSIRIDTLYKQAKTGKYSWAQLFNSACAIGVSSKTAKSYVDAVEIRLKKAGHLK